MAFYIIPGMSDTHERSMLYNDIKQAQPYSGMEQFWGFEIERRRFRKYSRTKMAVGLAGMLGVLVISLPATGSGNAQSLSLVPTLILALCFGTASMWLVAEEVIDRHKEVALTVDEAERTLSELAQKGHLDVSVEGSKLVYPL